MRKKILFVHTTGSWWDHRYYFKQMPALQEHFGDVAYLVKEDDSIDYCPFKLITISASRAKWARLTGGLNLFPYLFMLRQDAIQLCNLELLPLGVLLSIFSKKKIFYDCREDHYHAMLHSKVWFPKWIRYCLGFGVKVIEFLAAKTFTGFIESDPAIYGFHSFMPAKKKMIFYNMALKEQFNSSKINRKVKVFDFAVLGSMSIRTGVLDVVKAVAEINRRATTTKVRLKLIGDPRIDKKLWLNIKKVMVDNNLDEYITITGRVPYFQIPFLLADCKVGIIPLLNIPKFQNNIATKQFEYMASEMPIIASDLLPQRIFIIENYNGFYYTPGDIDQLIYRMTYFVDNDCEIARMGSNSKQKVEREWNSETQQVKFVEFYKLRMSNMPYIERQIPPFHFDL